MKSTFTLIVFLLSLNLSGQIAFNIVDDFNRSNSNTLGTTTSSFSTWLENEAASHPEQLQINGNKLYSFTGGVTGLEPTNASINLTNEISTFDLGNGTYGWSIHFDLDRNPSGWGLDNYGLGFVIAGNESNFSSTTVDGWAVLWTATNDELVLGKFENDISGNNPLTTIIGTGLDWDVCSTDGVNVRIQVDQNGNWTMYWEQGLPITTPTDIDAYSASSSSADVTYFDNPNLKYAGPIWAHSTSTAADSDGTFDNFSFGEESIGIVLNPSNFNAQTGSTTQINLTWLQNANGDDVMVATNTSNSFGSPSGTYNVNDPIGTATVIYIGPDESFSHTGLTAGTHHFYKAWSVDGSTNYSSGVIDSAYTRFPEPTNHPTGLTANSNGPVSITVSWTDADATHYLVKGSSLGYSNIVAPVDGVAQGDSLLVKNVNASVQSHQFTGLTPNTTYFFRIYPYNGTGEASNYKIDGTVPEALATTDELDLDLIISEVADPIQFNCRFVELQNTGTGTIDFSTDPVHFCRQSNGNPASWGSVQLTGTLAAGESYVIAYSSAYYDTAYGQTAERYSSTVNNDGNDAVFLYYGGNQATGYQFDAYGVMNEDGTGKSWFYEDGHAVRKRTFTSPDNSWNANEWAIVRNLNYKNMTPGMHSADITWQGTTSTNWNSRGNNWSGLYGWIPDASCNVTIPNVTNFPIVTGPSACHQLQIQSGSTLSVQSTGSLLIIGP